MLEDTTCPVYAMHERLKLDTLATRRVKAMVKLIYGLLHDQEPAYLYNKLMPVANGGKQTRACESGELVIPRAKSNYGSYAFLYRGPLQWNITKTDLKVAVNKLQLKTLIMTSW